MASYPALALRFRSGVKAGLRDDLLHAALDDCEPLAIEEDENDAGWLVYFRDEALRDAAAESVSPFLGQYLTSLATLDVPDEDWARRSQADLKAVAVGRLIIAPPWDLPGDHALVPAAGARAAGATDARVLIVIEPSMGFGTGHHQTTRLCLALLQRMDTAGRRVIDVGTGSGVLAIAAWALGASSVVAMDSDADALLNARENIARNGAAAGIEVVRADLSSFAAPPADIVTANLTAAVLARHAGRLRQLVKPGGALIVSGFSPDELAAVLSSLGVAEASDRAVENEWTAATLVI